MSSLVGTGVGDTVVEYMPLVKLTNGTAFHIALHEAFPYGLLTSVAVTLDDGYQLPHCVVVRFGTSLLSDAYGGACDVVVMGAGLDVAVRTVSDCVKLKGWKKYEGWAVA
jgi:hypothetical protein